MSVDDRSIAGTSRAPSLPPALLSARPNALALAKALRRRWLLACGWGLIVAGLAALVTWFSLAQKYTARTAMFVPLVDRFLLPTSIPKPDLVSHQKTQVALAKSRWLINAALKPQRQPDGSELRLAELSMLRDLEEPVEEGVAVLSSGQNPRTSTGNYRGPVDGSLAVIAS